MKKMFTFILILAMLFSFNTTLSFAEETNQEMDFLKVELGTRDLTETQIEKLSQEDASKIALRAQKDVDYLLYKCEMDMQQDIEKKFSKTLNRAATDVKLGTDKTFYSCDTGNKGSDSSLISGTKETYSANNAKSSSWTSIIGSGSSWAYTAKEISVSGSGSQHAYIRFYGSYAGMTNPGLMGGSAGARVRVSVYDLTTGSEITGANVININDSVASASIYSNTINSSVGVQLQAGHTYLLRYGIATSVSNYSPQMCRSNFYDGTTGANGVNVNSIIVDFT